MNSINRSQGKLTSKRSYFFKALYNWIIDNQLTPYIIVDAQFSGVRVPREYVNDNRITLNISPEATNLDPKLIDKLRKSHEILEFRADFDEPVGVQSMRIPMSSIVAIYAYENGEGTVFPAEESVSPEERSLLASKENHKKNSLNVTIVE